MEPAQMLIKQQVDKCDIERNCDTYTHCEILLSCKNEWNDDIHSNLDEIGDYYSKWSNSGMENQTYVLTYTWEITYEDAKA